MQANVLKRYLCESRPSFFFLYLYCHFVVAIVCFIILEKCSVTIAKKRPLTEAAKTLVNRNFTIMSRTLRSAVIRFIVNKMFTLSDVAVFE